MWLTHDPYDLPRHGSHYFLRIKRSGQYQLVPGYLHRGASILIH